MTSGPGLFKVNGCGSCHVLAAAGARGTVGPSLDARRPSIAQVKSALRDGPGGMPTYPQLSPKQADALARYVVASSRAK